MRTNSHSPDLIPGVLLSPCLPPLFLLMSGAPAHGGGGRVLLNSRVSDYVSPAQTCIVTAPAAPAASAAPTSGAPAPAPASQVSKVSISLADCLACAGCVTSAETVLLEAQGTVALIDEVNRRIEHANHDDDDDDMETTIHVHLTIHQASWAAIVHDSHTNGTQENEISKQPHSRSGSGSEEFKTRVARALMSRTKSANLTDDDGEIRKRIRITQGFVNEEDAARAVVADALERAESTTLVSACPAVVCYAETQAKTMLPYLSRILSPMAETGRRLRLGEYADAGARADAIHVAVMPCHDKKLEAARPDLVHEPTKKPFVDFVLTTSEFVELIGSSPPVEKRPRLADEERLPEQDQENANELMARKRALASAPRGSPAAFLHASGGFAHAGVAAAARQAGISPETVVPVKGRNADHIVAEVKDASGEVIARVEQVYGFRNLENLRRRLASRTSSSAGAGAGVGGRRVVEVLELMACPGGCANGGGQGAGTESRALCVESLVPSPPTVLADSSPSRTLSSWTMPGTRWDDMVKASTKTTTNVNLLNASDW